MKRTELLTIHLQEFWFAPCDAFLRAVEAVLWQKRILKPKILDIGCGDGRYDRLLFPKVEIDAGLDPDGPSIERARNWRFFKRLYRAGAENMPFKNSSFSTVVSNSVFEHIQKDLQAIREVSRVLKKGGLFLMTVPSPRLIKTLSQSGASQKWLQWFDKRVGHNHYRTREQWTKIFEKNSLKIEDCRFYFSDEAVKTWYRLFKLTTFRPYHRELWSYLKDSPYGKLFPRGLIHRLFFLLLQRVFKRAFFGAGNWMFITARKV